MKAGEVMERGNHAELIEMGGVYKSLVSRQLVSEELESENAAVNTTVGDEGAV